MNISTEFDNSLISEELINITSELTEVGIDSLLKDSVLRDLPVVGTLIGLTKIGIAINERIFIKKILRFLFQLKDIPAYERKQFVDNLNQEKKFNAKAGESLVLLIDKLNDYSKADYIGKLFAATISGKIDYNTFMKISSIIDKCFVPDLNYLTSIYKGDYNEVDDADKDILYNLGLLINLGVDGNTIMWKRGEVIPNKKNQLEINKYGKLIVELLLIPEVLK